MSLELNNRDLVKRLSKCNLCPRNCKVNRFTGDLGYCNLDASPLVSSITVHKGEEPIISGHEGICNVFFAHCNLSCVYCQNYQISRNYLYDDQWINDYEVILKKIIKILDQGINIIGFVSPTHQVIQMLEIINRLNQRGYNPVVLYNTNSYDNPDV
jgi:putative pyruvate formate lyase activating enzyme